jgi:short-subunit dehydrogenase
MSYKYFERKHVWITGASSGIGAGLAKELTKAGAIVSLSARREKEILDLIATIEKSGGKAHCFPLDITDSKAIVETHKKIISEVGPIDIVIANAGVGQSGVKAVDLTIEKVERMVDTNLTGAIMTIVACLPDMVARKSGHVVGISSLASYRGMPGSSVYSAVKAGLNIFLESVRIENIHNGISVTEICPGFVDTPILVRC